jgi:uncharacterized membrane protein YeaQ/YmgE (transglycosylase-associated protein family)
MNLIINLLLGAIIGSIAGRIMRTTSPLGWLVDMIEGAVGAFLAGYFISLLSKVEMDKAALTIPSLLAAMIGSVAMILIVKAVHQHDTEDRPMLGPGRTNRRD